MKSTRCEDFADLMVELLYDEASDEVRLRLEEHLSGCEGCRRDFAGLQRTRTRLRQAAPVVTPAPAPRVLVLGPVPQPRWKGWAGLAAAASLAAVSLLAVMTFARPGGLSSVDRAALREEILAAVDTYREEDRTARSAMLAAFQEELQDQESRRIADSEALANLLLASWNRTREDDLRFMLERLGTLEQRTGRNQELLQYAVFTGNPDEH